LIHLDIVDYAFTYSYELNEIDFLSIPCYVVDKGYLRGNDEAEKVSEGLKLRVVQLDRLVSVVSLTNA
jgi:hypothetical protein